MTCPDCERNKYRAALWRAEAYKQAGHDLIERKWVGLTDEEVNTIYEQAEVLVNNSWVGDGTVGLMFPITLYKMFETKLKDKNKHET